MDSLRTLTPADWFQLQLGWNTSLLFDSDIALCVFCVALIVDEWRVVRQSRKFYSGPGEITSFSRWDFSRSNKHDTFWHVVSTGYFYVLFLWAIAVPDFGHLEIYKNLGLPLFSIIIYSMKSVFSIKCTLKFFIFKFDLNVKYRSYFFK